MGSRLHPSSPSTRGETLRSLLTLSVLPPPFPCFLPSFLLDSVSLVNPYQTLCLKQLLLNSVSFQNLWCQSYLVSALYLWFGDGIQAQFEAGCPGALPKCTISQPLWLQRPSPMLPLGSWSSFPLLHLCAVFYLLHLYPDWYIDLDSSSIFMLKVQSHSCFHEFNNFMKTQGDTGKACLMDHRSSAVLLPHLLLSYLGSTYSVATCQQCREGPLFPPHPQASLLWGQGLPSLARTKFYKNDSRYFNKTEKKTRRKAPVSLLPRIQHHY